MKSGRITYYMEVPVEVDYSIHPEEKQTMEYQGCPQHLVVDYIGYPSEETLSGLVDKNAGEIKEACMEAAEI